jgi:hypothetical protein
MSKVVINHATPALTEVHDTAAEMVSCTTTHYNAMKASAEWALPPDVQVPANAWLATANALNAGEQQIENLLKQVGVARAGQLVLMRQWTTQGRVCLGAVDNHCDGSKDKVQALGYAVAGRTPRPAASTPTKLERKATKLRGLAIVGWVSDKHRHDYQVQWATNTADATTYSVPAVTSKRTFKLAGQVSGAVLYFRVQVIDAKLPAGHTDWTAWLEVTVS